MRTLLHFTSDLCLAIIAAWEIINLLYTLEV
jgi:hypothetical protein